MNAVADNLVMWGRSRLGWTPNGQRLVVEIALFGRGSMLFGERIRATLQEFDELSSADATIDFRPGSISSTSTATNAEWAILTIVAPGLFEVTPEALRLALGSLAYECRAQADEQQRHDEAIGGKWFERLRNGAASPGEN